MLSTKKPDCVRMTQASRSTISRSYWCCSWPHYFLLRTLVSVTATTRDTFTSSISCRLQLYCSSPAITRDVFETRCSHHCIAFASILLLMFSQFKRLAKIAQICLEKLYISQINLFITFKENKARFLRLYFIHHHVKIIYVTQYIQQLPRARYPCEQFYLYYTEEANIRKTFASGEVVAPWANLMLPVHTSIV